MLKQSFTKYVTHRFILAFPDAISDRGKNKKLRLLLGTSKGHLSHQISSLNNMPVPSRKFLIVPQ